MTAETEALMKAREAARAAFAHFGGTFVEPAILQPAHTYLELSGEELRARLVVTASASGGDELCLRPDLTVAVALEKLSRGDGAPGAVLYDGPAFRQPLSMADRPIEFPQTGREKFGGADPAHDDAEALSAALDACRACGVNDARIVLADAGLSVALAHAFGLHGSDALRAAALLKRPDDLAGRPAMRSALGQALSGLSPDDAEKAVGEILTIAGAEPIGGRTAKDIARRLLARGATQAGAPEKLRAAAKEIFAIAGEPAKAVASIEAAAKAAGATLSGWADHWRLRLASMEKAGVDLTRARFDAGREFRFGYYDGFVFELVAERLRDGAGAPIGAGGRYDGLMGKLSGGRVAMSAAGAMVRVDRLVRVTEAAS